MAYCSWAAYVAGALLVLMHEEGHLFQEGLSLLIWSKVPDGKGVSSSAALEAAAMTAISSAYGIRLEPPRLASLCQLVDFGLRSFIYSHRHRASAPNPHYLWSNPHSEAAFICPAKTCGRPSWWGILWLHLCRKIGDSKASLLIPRGWGCHDTLDNSKLLADVTNCNPGPKYLQVLLR